ncbi:hypothetical protein [Mesorhizobium sp. M0488]|uniref:hypothetical protein n=1 Tax=unclassified Mesorhizobium TaxID=325217 RepID=UPI00333751DF
MATLGVPRIGRRRELKSALESYWSGTSSAADLLDSAKRLRAASWIEQRDRGMMTTASNSSTPRRSLVHCLSVSRRPTSTTQLRERRFWRSARKVSKWRLLVRWTG